MTDQLKTFLENRNEQDFTKKQAYASRKAKEYLNSDHYEDGDTVDGYDVHISLLILIDPKRDI